MMTALGTKTKKKVVTLDRNELQREMSHLLDLVRERGHQPDLIVGIATGGALCAETLRPVTDLPIMSCAMRRKSTEAKKKFPLTKLLAYLPYAITDILRRHEDKALEKTAVAKLVIPAPSDDLRQDLCVIAQAVKSQGYTTVLVVDDAVDSGATMGCVTLAMREYLPAGTTLVSGVVTQTRPDPVYTPDVALHYLVLCRFPWSFDYRGR